MRWQSQFGRVSDEESKLTLSGYAQPNHCNVESNLVPSNSQLAEPKIHAGIFSFLFVFRALCYCNSLLWKLQYPSVRWYDA